MPGDRDYRIILKGCDESTVVTVTLDNPADVAILEHVADLTRRASEYDCMPRMTIERANG